MFRFFKKNNPTDKVESQNSIQHSTLKIIGMHCTSCSMAIDGELEELSGVKDVHTNYAKAETKISFDPKKIDLEKILATIKSLGYTAQAT
ncbi:MAG: heavy metal transporter [Candidatus Pacebacteria bacterium CG10_big_fil_rev_8_21_14_0_10_36_11]|nr:heavy-metal-associated domain-containing protein [Candidatus Pacearchaeota archaeon]OIP74313.1 MAG: hypothetical protein AUK08_00820 [Candidatus Pacebacteria bacterium CG2_30_36_39]PIR64877.1 MAG: heavy metal transporter [Candidatus Pacebacteria bacterium CG10_big_fil_rev_8_21_14_0_10_36_11]PJC43119.1 MAG: heavy metal transporter [Candidatus Pacebacteria bacterium CG_4_9_14_0_2_um_filter_36_8]